MKTCGSQRATSRIFGLAPSESATVPVTFTTAAGRRRSIRIVAVDGTNRMPLDVPVFPAAEPATVFQIADGTTVDAWQHGTQHGEVSLGEGNGDRHAAPGENFAVLFPDGEYLRAAELFTNDACVDNTMRASDSVGEHASVKYSLPTIRPECSSGARRPHARAGGDGWRTGALLVGGVSGVVSE